MVQVRICGFSCIGHLVTNAEFNSDKEGIFISSYPFIDFSYMVYMIIKAVEDVNRKLVFNVWSCQHQMG